MTNVTRIVIKPYQTAWVEEFAALGRDLRANLGPLALRIDHIAAWSKRCLSVDLQKTARGKEISWFGLTFP